MTDTLRFDPVASFDTLSDEAERALETLEKASEPANQLAARSVLARTLPWLERAGTDHRPGRAKRRERVDAIRRAAQPLLAKASPEPIAAPARRRGGLFSALDAVADRGVSGGGHELPFRDRIQASFGHHDVSTIRAHTDDSARASAHQLDARAFAIGDQVAFGDTPDLHTAAHEAAHVIQQRDRVAFKRGGSASDDFERHADAVADAVVRGDSAESLLDDGAGRASPVVRKKAGSVSMDAAAYTAMYAAKMVAGIYERMTATEIPWPHKRISWANPEQAIAAIASAIDRYVTVSPQHALERLTALAHPVDLASIIDRARLGRPPDHWQHDVAVAVGIAFDEPIDASIRRMGERLRVQLDGPMRGSMPSEHQLVASSPLDRVMAAVLTTRSLVETGGHRRDNAPDTPGQPFVHGTHEVEYEWLGGTDPNLWNWIRVTSPKNPTVEDVAYTPVIGDQINGAEHAYRIAARPPLFGIPFDTAKTIPQAIDRAPEELRYFLVDHPAPHIADADALDRSVASDDIALRQAPHSKRTDVPLDQLVRRIAIALSYVQSVTAPWGQADKLTAALLFLSRRVADLSRDSKTTRWSSVLVAQEQALHGVTSALSNLSDVLVAKRIAPSNSPGLRPVVEVLGAFARAAGTSHLAGESQAALDEALRLERLLPLALTEQSVLAARDMVATQRVSELVYHDKELESDHIEDAAMPLMQRVADLRLHAIRGDRVDPEEVTTANTDALELQMRSRLLELAATLRGLQKQADDEGFDADRPGAPQPFADKMLALIYREAASTGAVRGGWWKRLDEAKNWTGPQHGKTASQTKQARMQDAIVAIKAEMARVDGWVTIEEYKKNAEASIDEAKAAARAKAIAIQIIAMVVTGELAGAALSAIRGFAIAGEVAAEIRGAGLAWRAAEVMVHAGLQTTVQGVMGGGDLGVRDVAENALGILLTNALMRPFEGLLGATSEIEGRIVKRFAAYLGKGAADIVVGTGAGVIASGVAHAVTHNTGLGIADRKEWAVQSVSLAASKFVAIRTHQMKARIVEAAHRAGIAPPAGTLERADALIRASEQAGKAQPSEEQAAGFLAERQALLTSEVGFYDKHRLADTDPVRSQRASDVAATGSKLADVPLRLAGVSEIVDGKIFEGTKAQIERGFDNARAEGFALEVMQNRDTGLWTARAGERVLEIHQTDFVATKLAASPERVVLAGDDGQLRAAAARAKPLPGYLDVIAHGDADSFIVVRDHSDIHLDQRSMATYLRKHGLDGSKIRLIACEAGLTPFAVAQHLSNKLGVEVLAPTKTVWIDREGNVGVGAKDQHEGRFESFKPKASSQDGSKARMIEPPVPDHAGPSPDHEPPLDVRFDHRERYNAANHDELQARLGKRLVVGDGMVDGVTIMVERKPAAFGVDYEVLGVRIGPHALAADIVSHVEHIRQIERYNGLVGKLRRFSDRLRGKSGTRFDGEIYPHGSRGWVLANEIAKVGKRIADTVLARDGGHVDANQANHEIAFLEGADAYFREQVRDVDASGHDPLFDFSHPDIGETTRAAEAAGYKRPGQEGAKLPGLELDPDNYFYRRSASDPSIFELARKPGADTPQLQARVVGGRFIGVELPARKPALELSAIEPGKELDTLYDPSGSMAPYAAMLERTGVAPKTVIDGAALMFHRQHARKPHATIDDWRHSIKEYFRQRVVDKLANPALDDATSYRQMRAMLDGLGNSDRGSLAEDWYRARHASGAKARERYDVTRTSGTSVGKTETRVTDMIVNGEIRELKDIEGEIDKEQYGAYVDLLRDDKLRQKMGVESLRYVFTKPTGAIANLEFFSQQFATSPVKELLAVECFDIAGTRHVVTGAAEARALLARLQGGR